MQLTTLILVRLYCIIGSLRCISGSRSPSAVDTCVEVCSVTFYRTYLSHLDGSRLHPQALLTDMYQITMTYAYWKAGRHEEDVR